MHPPPRPRQVITAQGHGAPVDWWSVGILLYELTYGFTPFRGARRDETFENVLKQPLRFPAKPVVSLECQVRNYKEIYGSRVETVNLPAVSLL